jgi:hypothetical protein
MMSVRKAKVIQFLFWTVIYVIFLSIGCCIWLNATGLVLSYTIATYGGTKEATPQSQLLRIDITVLSQLLATSSCYLLSTSSLLPVLHPVLY